MIISKKKLDKIKKIIEKNYNKLIISILGNSLFDKEDLEKLQKQGIDINNPDSFLEIAYHHNILNHQNENLIPSSVEEMENQQKQPGIKHKGEEHDYTVYQLNENAKKHFDKIKMDTTNIIINIINNENQTFKYDKMQDNLDSEKEKTKYLNKMKDNLRYLEEPLEKDFGRIIRTEISNAVGLGSADRVVKNNKEKDLNDVYVYRIAVNDNKLCKFCREFYIDNDGSPKVYKLSTLIANGSNYGKKSVDWRPSVNVIHPNCRESQIIELKPGWMVLPNGSVKFIGLNNWKDYILNKVQK